VPDHAIMRTAIRHDVTAGWHWGSVDVPTGVSKFWDSRIGRRKLLGEFGSVSGIRWFELRNVTAGPVSVFQQSTYQPDSTWRWMGSAAMDQQGNLAIGYSASSSTIFPQFATRAGCQPIPSTRWDRAKPHSSLVPAVKPEPVIGGVTTAI
jgi:hypothetical protein